MLVNDFGSAVKIGTQANKGNPYFMPKAVFERDGMQYEARPAHDLETFVKVLMYGIRSDLQESLRDLEPAQAPLWWALFEEKDRTLKYLLTTARDCNYDELKAGLEALVFKLK